MICYSYIPVQVVRVEEAKTRYLITIDQRCDNHSASQNRNARHFLTTTRGGWVSRISPTVALGYIGKPRSNTNAVAVAVVPISYCPYKTIRS